MKNMINLLIKVIALTLFRVEYAAANDSTSEVEPGYEYKEDEFPTLLSPEAQEKLAQEYGMDNQNKGVEKAPEKKEDKPEFDQTAKVETKKEEKQEDKTDEVSLKYEGELTKEKATALLKDYEDDEEVEFPGADGKPVKQTKAEFLKQFDKPESKTEDKTYTIGKDTLNQKEFDALLEKAAKHYGWDEEYIKGRREKDLLKDIETFKNIDTGKKEVAADNQALAKIRRDLTRQAEFVENKLQEYSDAKKEDSAAKTINEEIIQLKVSDFDDDDEIKLKNGETLTKDELKTRRVIAQRENEKIDTKIKKTDAEIEKLERQAVNLFYHSVFIEIDDTIPELKLPEPATTILNKLNKGDYTDYDTAQKANLVLNLANDYRVFLENNPESKLSPEAYFKVNRFRYNVPAATEKKEKKPEADTTLKKRVIKLLNNQGKPFVPKGTSGDPVIGNDQGSKAVQEAKRKAGYEDDYAMVGVYD